MFDVISYSRGLRMGQPPLFATPIEDVEAAVYKVSGAADRDEKIRKRKERARERVEGVREVAAEAKRLREAKRNAARVEAFTSDPWLKAAPGEMIVGRKSGAAVRRPRRGPHKDGRGGVPGVSPHGYRWKVKHGKQTLVRKDTRPRRLIRETLPRYLRTDSTRSYMGRWKIMWI
jgi:hypothetical protein